MVGSLYWTSLLFDLRLFQTAEILVRSLRPSMKMNRGRINCEVFKNQVLYKSSQIGPNQLAACQCE